MGEEFSTVHTVRRSKQGLYQRSLSGIQPDKLPAVQPTRPKATLPRATTAYITIIPKTPTEKVLEMLHALPQTLLPSLGISLNMDIARQEAQRPVGARLQHFLPNWQAITDDPWILNTIRGYSLELTSTPRQHHPTPPIALNQEKSAALTAEIDKLLQKEAIRPVKASLGEFLSPIFLVPKADGSWRPVINLRDLNSHITQHHFKMQGIRTVKGLMRKGDWLTKLNLKDAYLSVPMNQAHTHLLRFQWQSQTYQFDTLPFGLSSAPYVFTKLLKPVVAILRRLGIRVVLYLDDMLIMASSKEEARAHLATAMHLLTALGFILNLDKSVLTPTQRVIFLGFCLDSRTMLISLPTPRIQSIQRLIREILAQGQASILKLSQLLGSMVSTHPAVLGAPLHYRHLERAKITALKHSQNSNTLVTTSDNMRQDLTWWFQELPQTQWQVNANSAVGHGDRIRCIDAGLGSESQQHQHRRTMGTTREVIPHQLPRVTGSIFGPQDLCHQRIQQGNSPEIRQCDSHCLPQQNGGDPFRDTLQSGSAHFGMVLGEEYIHPCRTPTREAECQSRLALTTHTGLQRLAATPSDLPTTSRQAGPFLNRPVCVTHKYSAFNLLQLETGSICNSNRCPVNLMERSSSLSVPTILTSQSLSGEDQLGEGGGCSNSTSVVQPGMVPFTAPESTGCTNLAPQHDGHNTESSGRATPTCSGGTSSTSRMACIRESYGAKGLSDRVVSIMQMSWRTSTESAYSSVWRRWSSWCAQRQADPVSAPLNVILDYLTQLYQEGKQYRTINTARSAISMTHDLVDGWRVGQHPITIRFLRGIFNSCPPDHFLGDCEFTISQKMVSCH